MKARSKSSANTMRSSDRVAGLEVCAVSAGYGARKILHEVTFTAAVKRVLAIVGPNGAGKSTLLKILSGELCPQQGEVKWDGRLVGDYSTREWARRRAILPQDSALNFPFTVQEVVLMGRTPHLRSGEPAEDRAIMRRALELVGLKDWEERRYTTLSGGERQRVHLARVLAQIWHEPEAGAARLLLLDEPTSSLDPLHQQTTLALARNRAKEGVAVVVVLHDLNLALRYADDVLMLHKGKVAACGAAAETLRPELIRQVFSVPTELLQGGGGYHLAFLPIDDVNA